jgi:hypothetical protein
MEFFWHKIFFAPLFRIYISPSRRPAHPQTIETPSGIVAEYGHATLRPTILWYAWCVWLCVSTLLPVMLMAMDETWVALPATDHKIRLSVLIALVICLIYALWTLGILLATIKLLREKKELLKTEFWQWAPTRDTTRRLLAWLPYGLISAILYGYLCKILDVGNDARVQCFWQTVDAGVLGMAGIGLMAVYFLVVRVASNYFFKLPWLDNFFHNKKILEPVKRLVLDYVRLGPFHHVFITRNADDIPKQFLRSALVTVFFSDRNNFSYKIIPARYVACYLGPLFISYIALLGAVMLLPVLYPGMSITFPFVFSSISWAAGAVGAYSHFVKNMMKDTERNKKRTTFQLPFIDLVTQQEWDERAGILLEKSIATSMLIALTLAPITWTFINALAK